MCLARENLILRVETSEFVGDRSPVLDIKLELSKDWRWRHFQTTSDSDEKVQAKRHGLCSTISGCVAMRSSGCGEGCRRELDEGA
jgi:hypothetical protein